MQATIHNEYLTLTVDTHGAELPDEDRKAITLFLTRVNG